MKIYRQIAIAGIALSALLLGASGAGAFQAEVEPQATATLPADALSSGGAAQLALIDQAEVDRIAEATLRAPD